MSRLLRVRAFSCGEPAAGTAPKFVELSREATFEQFAEAAGQAFAQLIRPRLYVHIPQLGDNGGDTCEVTCEGTWRGALTASEALAPDSKARRPAASL